MADVRDSKSCVGTVSSTEAEALRQGVKVWLCHFFFPLETMTQPRKVKKLYSLFLKLLRRKFNHFYLGSPTAIGLVGSCTHAHQPPS
jgi:hypothetical protein